MNLVPAELDRIGRFMVELAKYEEGASAIFASSILNEMNTREISAVTKLINPRRIDRLRDDRDV